MNRLKTGVLLGVVTVIALLIPATSASAQSCNTVGASSAFAFSYGSLLATGRTNVSVVVSQKDNWSIQEMVPAGLTIVAQRADGSLVAQQTVTADELYDAPEEWVVTLKGIPPKGAVRLTTTWTEAGEATTPGCFADSATLTRGQGKYIRFGKWLSPRRGLAAHAVAKGIPQSCNALAMTPVKLRVTTRNGANRATRAISLSDQCALSEDHSKSLPGGTVTLGSDGAGLSVAGPWKEFRYFDLVLSDASGKDQKATISSFYQPPYRIWQNDDEYWNYCIKKNIDIKMDQGYLYCLHSWRVWWWLGTKVLNAAGDTFVDA
jgi:hypothetical protein